QNQPRRDDFGLKIGKLSHRTSIKDGLGRHIGSCGPLNRNFLKHNDISARIPLHKCAKKVEDVSRFVRLIETCLKMACHN
ncbi:hypothetical protein, partial [Escherichia coli]|uniref:hypothetical protein n=1 Tax=Escherichia coli TaxID=562 RepID=UPI001BDC48A0